MKRNAQTEGGDTNWGVGSVSLRGIFIFLLSWIEETLTQLWQMSEVFVLVSNPYCSCVGRRLTVLTRKTGWGKKGERRGESKERGQELYGVFY